MLIIYEDMYKSEEFFRRLFGNLLWQGPDYYEPNEPCVRDAAGMDWYLM